MKLRKCSILLTLFFFFTQSTDAQDLVLPIEGTYGVDYIIVNYPDWHLTDGPVLVEDGFLNDFQCGSKTYDGHQGTDFVIRGFAQMDSSVNVLAVADGLIIHVTEDLFDRETDGIIADGLGNYVGIYHASSDTYTYYAHLKTNSVPVEEGDFVAAGQIIGQVGSSGNSTDPHLHFEMWNPGVLTDPTIDPWGTPCAEGSNLWADSPAYDTTYAVWEHGFVNYDTVDNFIPSTWLPLKERMDLRTAFTTDDDYFTFWALQYGLKIGDQTSIEWIDPTGAVYASETTNYTTQDWWFHYYNHSISRPPLYLQGVWTVNYYYNDSLVLVQPVSYGNLSVLENDQESNELTITKIDHSIYRVQCPNASLEMHVNLYALNGQLLFQEKCTEGLTCELKLPPNLETGLYLILVTQNNTQFQKIVFIE